MYNLIDTLVISCKICTSNVINLLNVKNLQVTKAFNSWVGTSEAIRLLNKNFIFSKNKQFSNNNTNNNNIKFNEWLAGLIDGDGSFLLSQKGYASLEITMDIRDEHALQIIKNVYGGSIKLRSGANALRYRLHHKSGLLVLINDVNGHIRDSNRLIQLNKICDKYNLKLIYPEKLSYHNGWLSGFFDAEGLLDYKIDNNKIPKLFVEVNDRSYNMVILFKSIFGGYIYINKNLNNCYTWCLESDKDNDLFLNFFQYIKTYPLKANRHKKFFLIPEFNKVLDLKAYKASKESILSKVWTKFNNKFKRGLHTSNLNYNNINLSNKNSSTKIVIWGINMESGIAYGRLNKQVLDMYKFNSFQFSVIIGLLLSDAWIIYSKRSVNPRLGFKQSLNKFNYFFKIYSILSPFCSSLPSLIISKRKNTITYGLNLFTRSLPCIKDLHSSFYFNNKKIIPKDIYHLLDPISLAHWICGDGQKRSQGLVLCTDSYSIKEVVILVNVLIIKYNLICYIRENNKNQYRIYISEKSMDKLREIVLPYMDNSMLYKIN